MGKGKGKKEKREDKRVKWIKGQGKIKKRNEFIFYLLVLAHTENNAELFVRNFVINSDYAGKI